MLQQGSSLFSTSFLGMGCNGRCGYYATREHVVTPILADAIRIISIEYNINLADELIRQKSFMLIQ